MKLSIILVNWNTEDLTRQTLESVFKETKNLDFEVIVVDNNSTRDNSVEMIKREFPQVVLIENEDNLGFGRANNQGMKIANGDYIFLLNTDTIVLGGGINKLVDYLDNHPDIMRVGPKLLNEDRTFQYACRRKLPTPINSFFHLFGLVKIFKKNKKINEYKQYSTNPDKTEQVEAISGAAMMFRREVFDMTGGFDEDFFLYGEDLDFCKRIFDRGWKTVYVHDAEIIHLGGASTGKRRTKSLINFYDSMWIYYKKHYYKDHNMFVRLVVYLGIKLKLSIVLVLNFLKRT